MAVIQSYNDLISRACSATLGGYLLKQPIWGEVASGTGAALGGNLSRIQRVGWTKTLPSPLPTGVSAYVLTRASLIVSSSSAMTLMLAKIINLGSLDISGASGTFTDGSPFPTVTEANQSRQLSGPVFIEVTTALAASAGNVTITYTDQDGNTAETTAIQSLVGSSAVRSGGWIVLNGTDIGVRDITDATRSGGSSPSGVVQFWGIVPICAVQHQPVANAMGVVNLITGNFNPIRLAAGDNLGVFSFNIGTTLAVTGELVFVGDST